jgi:NADPH:quinone reductase-like Zn-dependent oxidoreductase
MKRYIIKNEKLVLEETNIPLVKDNEVLVKIKAVSLNYRDLLVTEGRGSWKPTETRVPVSDGAGEVIEIGKLVNSLKKGDRVTSLFAPNWSYGKLEGEKINRTLGGAKYDGVLSEYVVFPENTFCKFPDYLSYKEASTLPVAALTAWNAVIEQSNLKIGDSILLLGTGGVSCFAFQFSKLAGYQIIHTSSSNDKLAIVQSMGAHHTINYKENSNWIEKVLEITKNKGVNQVVDVIGGNHLNESLKCLQSQGIISMIGVMDGTTGTIDTGMVMVKAAKIQGVEVGSTEMYKRMLHAMDVHKIKPIINKVYSFTETLDAFDYLKKGNHFGKICIEF